MKRAILFLLVAASALVAEDFWKAKDASQWSEKDVRKMLRDSPWAKEITLNMPGSGMRRGGGGDIGGVGDISGGGMDSESGGGSMGGGGGRRGRGRQMSMEAIPQGPKIVVRWETAAPVREAAGKAGLGTIRPEAVEKFYVVSITGFPLPGGRGGRGAAAEGQDPHKEMREALMKETVLKRKDKDPVVPVRVDIIPSQQGATLMFVFLRSVEIGADDKEVVFSTRMGPTKVNSKFQLKNMVYHGALAL